MHKLNPQQKQQQQRSEWKKDSECKEEFKQEFKLKLKRSSETQSKLITKQPTNPTRSLNIQPTSRVNLLYLLLLSIPSLSQCVHACANKSEGYSRIECDVITNA